MYIYLPNIISIYYPWYDILRKSLKLKAAKSDKIEEP